MRPQTHPTAVVNKNNQETNYNNRCKKRKRSAHDPLYMREDTQNNTKGGTEAFHARDDGTAGRASRSVSPEEYTLKRVKTRRRCRAVEMLASSALHPTTENSPDPLSLPAPRSFSTGHALRLTAMPAVSAPTLRDAPHGWFTCARWLPLSPQRRAPPPHPSRRTAPLRR